MTPFGLPPWIVLAFLFAVGTVLGRWLNVFVDRIPYRMRMADQWRACSDRIVVEDALRAGWPIVGPLTAGGSRVFGTRGRGVRASIVELANGVLLAVLYVCEIPFDPAAGVGASCASIPAPFDGHLIGSPWSPTVLLHLRFLGHALLVQCLYAATLVDIRTKLIPGITTDPLILFGVLFSFAVGGTVLAPVWFQDGFIVRLLLGSIWPDVPPGLWVPEWIAGHPHLHGLAASVAGVAVGGGLVWVLRVVGSWTLGREAMGQGDVFLMMAVGAVLGWQASLVVFFIAPIAALAVHAVQWVVVREGEIPYGPYLSLSTLLVLLGWNRVFFPSTQQLFAFGPILVGLGLFMSVAMVGLLLFTRFVKVALGIPLDDEEVWTEWSPADQHVYQAGERADDRRGRWRGRRWPGVSTARGRSHHDRWRRRE